MPTLNTVELLVAKRDGHRLPTDAIRALIAAYTAGEVPDYQMSAFLMAAFLQGLDDDEMFALTEAMLHSGAVLDLSDIPGTKVDKHSTGGVGDKVSLILAPLVAACGVPVPMISGRGLAHSGGTLDKLEAIPGFRTDLDLPAYRRQLADLGVVMIGQTAEIAPADRKIYALRDVTGTVPFRPFIAASIMSKKLAEGIDALVLDVKCGKGAFMQTEADARALAETLVQIGEHFGTTTVAHMTAMDAPLGYGIGCWPETLEAIRCLKGDHVPDLMTVTYTLAGEMLYLGGAAASPQEGEAQARSAIADGRAFAKMCDLVAVQGGDVEMLEHPERRPGAEPAAVLEVPEDATGYLAAADALQLGLAAVALGAGRTRKEDAIDPTAGMKLHAKPGDAVTPGQPLVTLYTRKHADLPALKNRVLNAFTFTPTPPQTTPLLIDRYQNGSWDSSMKG